MIYMIKQVMLAGEMTQITEKLIMTPWKYSTSKRKQLKDLAAGEESDVPVNVSRYRYEEKKKGCKKGLEYGLFHSAS